MLHPRYCNCFIIMEFCRWFIWLFRSLLHSRTVPTPPPIPARSFSRVFAVFIGPQSSSLSVLLCHWNATPVESTLQGFRYWWSKRRIRSCYSEACVDFSWMASKTYGFHLLDWQGPVELVPHSFSSSKAWGKGLPVNSTWISNMISVLKHEYTLCIYTI